MSANFQIIKGNGSQKRFCLELNSHSLSYYQLCEEKFNFKEIKILAEDKEYYPFKRGAGIAHVLGIWYLAKQRNYNPEKLQKLEDFMWKKMMRSNSFINNEKQIDDKIFLASRMVGYFNKYRANDRFDVVAVEKGFTKILYEDKYHLFVYSGRPDLVVDFGKDFGIGPIDHKSESFRNDIAPFNNQFMGYCWALDAKYGMINYIGLQKDNKQGDVLRREAFSFNPTQIDKWKSDTTEWFFRITHSITQKRFLRSWNCAGKYGLCEYYPLCTSSSDNERKVIEKRNFKKLEKPYTSW